MIQGCLGGWAAVSRKSKDSRTCHGLDVAVERHHAYRAAIVSSAVFGDVNIPGCIDGHASSVEQSSVHGQPAVAPVAGEPIARDDVQNPIRADTHYHLIVGIGYVEAAIRTDRHIQPERTADG